MAGCAAKEGMLHRMHLRLAGADDGAVRGWVVSPMLGGRRWRDVVSSEAAGRAYERIPTINRFDKPEPRSPRAIQRAAWQH
ncbi:MAG: hypothetical protein QOD93_1713 [Acetobacteraceae bacterium]|nr:hypothetical protein [Acetobacteraceae bacterium]